MPTTPTVLFGCLRGSERASRVVTFGCELGALESSGPARDRWDDVPAVSDGDTPARDVIVRRISGLLDELSRPA